MDPSFFFYSLDCAPMVETWANGLVVLHNPNALRPIPHDFFVGAVQSYVDEGSFRSVVPDWHPISSQTVILDLGSAKKEMPEFIRERAPVLVHSITKERFRRIAVSLPDDNPFVEEQGWFADGTLSFLGVVVRDKNDQDWGWVILARDSLFRFRAIHVQSGLESRVRARTELQGKIAGLLKAPQRVFPQE
jgi:hypothetical protein